MTAEPLPTTLLHDRMPDWWRPLALDLDGERIARRRRGVEALREALSRENVIDAVGYSSAKVREEMIDIFFDGAIAVQHGMASSTPQETLTEVLRNKKFTVTIDLHLGSAEYKVFTTDLTPEYVKFNMGE